MSAKKRKAGKKLTTEDVPREIELKLELASGNVEALLQHSALAQARPLPGEGGQLHAVYYDTDDHSLRHAGISLRIRRKNGRDIQTIKAEKGKRGIAMDRGEWEVPVDGALDFAAAADTPLGSLLSDGLAPDMVKPQFTVETQRRAFEVARDGAVIEMAFDEAKVSAGQTLQFSEVELELKRGDPGVLFTLACNLAEAAPLRLSPVTKSDRGYRLLGNSAVGPFKAEKIELPDNATCAKAFQIIARSCLSQMVLNEPLVRQTQAPEALHQMRVGLRRLRAAMSLFKNHLLADPESAEIKDSLRWAGQSLGAARDLDVFLERLQEFDESEYDPSDLEKIEQRRSQAYKDLLETLDTPRFMDVILRTAAWIEAGDWVTSNERGLEEARERPAKDFAASELSRRFRRIRKLAKHLRDLDDEERHELRIRIKKLRYGAEFFQSLFSSGKAHRRRKKLSGVLENLQELLGELNDLAVGTSLVPSLPTLPPERLERRQAKLLDKAETAALKLSKVEPFWR